MKDSAISSLQRRVVTAGTRAEFVTLDRAMPARSIRDGAAEWQRALHQAGIGPGDRVVCALPNGAAFAQLVLATIAAGITFVPVGTRACDPQELLETFDASLVVGGATAGAHCVEPGIMGGAPSSGIVPRRATVRTDRICFILSTSGSTGTPVRVALSDTNVDSVLQSHLPHLAVDDASFISVLPWSHVFGLVLDLLPALLYGRRIVSLPDSGRDASSVIAAGNRYGTSHLNMVPLLASALAATSQGLTLLRQLRGGIIGGAPIDADLSTRLLETPLRVGYGQTEASPGIMLGARGRFHGGMLGRPVGCDVRIDADGELAFRGANACAGYWTERTLVRAAPDRWHRTGDLVTAHDGEYTFVGRAAGTFKLANGRKVVAPPIESEIRARFPAIRDIVLMSPDSREIRLYYSTADGSSIDDDVVRIVLVGLARYYAGSARVPADAWARTPKGLIDRRSMPLSEERTAP